MSLYCYEWHNKMKNMVRAGFKLLKYLYQYFLFQLYRYLQSLLLLYIANFEK